MVVAQQLSRGSGRACGRGGCARRCSRRRYRHSWGWSLSQIDSSPRTSRRDFLRWTVAGASAFFLAEAAAGFVAFFWPNKIGAFGSKITVPAANIPKVGADPIVDRDGKFWLINNEDGALALYWKCVHLGCTVPWNATEKDVPLPLPRLDLRQARGAHRRACPAPARHHGDVGRRRAVRRYQQDHAAQRLRPSQAVKLP